MAKRVQTQIAPLPGPTRGRNLFWVLAHELGHSLGLDHSPLGVESIMTPHYRGYESSMPRLFPYDYKRIQMKYAAPVENSVIENSVALLQDVPERDPHDLCSLQSFDTIFTLPNGNLYVANGALYWRISVNGTRFPGYPQRLSQLFPSIEGPVDSVFTDRFDWTWVIKGNQVWKVDASGDETVVGPKTNLRDASPFSNYVHSAVNAVLAVNGQQNTQPSVFFLGTTYWVDDNYDGFSDDNTEHKIAEMFLGANEAPERISGAVWLSTDGSFIFSESQFWKVKVERTELKVIPGYPRSTWKHLFGC
ncbi:hypothetical protein L596_015060 [Steinernema carpocapsae]|uniref:Peptidase M10 metallopeptidase domain-containing protein n=1 Tax=Steinernema carpocapsae TaxID=34508 RepID=A0A4U5NF39_STECR|nr:hypothetical protein L596_015060 [Steinernema carpocapsae]